MRLILLCIAISVVAATKHYVRVGPAAGSHSVRVLLKQRNLLEFHSRVQNRERFSQDEIKKLLSPSDAARIRVMQFFKGLGFEIPRNMDRGDSFDVKGSVALIESTLMSKMHRMRSLSSGVIRPYLQAPIVPSEIADFVEGFAGITSLPLPHRKSPKQARKVLKGRKADTSYGSAIPAFIRDLYSIPVNASAAGTSICLVEFTDYGSYSVPGAKKMLEECNEHPAVVNTTVGN